jgi:SNF2 family DNA or RNA helicase
MLKKARIKVAESIRKIEKPDDWQWKRWLNKPPHTKINFSIFKVKVSEENLFTNKLPSPKVYLKLVDIPARGILERKEFDRLLKVKATKSKSIVIQPARTNPVFFQAVKAKISQNYMPHEDPAKIKHVGNLNNLFTETKTLKIEIKDKTSSTYQKFYHEEMLNKELRYSWSYSSESISQYNLAGSWIIKGKKLSDSDSRTEKFFFSYSNVTDNLLPTSENCKLLKDEIISRFYFINTNVTNNLLLTSSFTYDIRLLNVAKLEVTVSDLRLITLTNEIKDSEFINQSVLALRKSSENISGFEVKAPAPVKISKNINTNIQLKTKKIYLFKDNLNKIPSIQALKNQNLNLSKPKLHEEELTLVEAITQVQLPYLQYEGGQSDALYSFQKTGVDFLINHTFAVLADEHGLGKTVQVVNSLKFLFTKNRIKSVLLLTNKSELGNTSIIHKVKNSEGWCGHFISWASNLNVNTILDEEPHRSKKWNKPAQVFISTYNSLSKDYESGIISREILRKFDCIVLDNFFYAKINLTIKNCFAEIKPKYFWAIANNLKNETEDEFSSNLQTLYCNSFNKKMNGGEWSEFYNSNKIQRNLSDVKKELPERIYHNKWFNLVPEQLKELEGILQEGEVTIYSTIERGNYYIVRPQIFNILHQLKQVSNFSSGELYSDKAKELLGFIKSTDDKIVVFSQYEKLGLDRLEKLFESNNLSFVTFKIGMMETSLDKAILDFREGKVQIFLADVKAIKKKINLGAIPTIIHFDHWWNPNAIWQLEDKIDFGINKNPVNVYNYWTNALIEENIFLKLTERGLFYKNIFYNLSISTVADFISVEEWLGMFNIKIEETSDLKINKDIISKIKNVEEFSQEDLIEMVKKFLIKLGFGSTKFLEQEYSPNDEVVFASKIIGNKEENVLIHIRANPKTDLNVISQFLNSFTDYHKSSKSFIITSGKFTEECRKFSGINAKLLNLVDGTLFANILSQFNLI